jgi:hypothetical protein
MIATNSRAFRTLCMISPCSSLAYLAGVFRPQLSNVEIEGRSKVAGRLSGLQVANGIFARLGVGFWPPALAV